MIDQTFKTTNNQYTTPVQAVYTVQLPDGFVPNLKTAIRFIAEQLVTT